MTRPRRLKVGYRTFPIRWPGACETDIGAAWGYIHFGDEEDPHIAIASSGHNDKAETLLHEIVHAVIHDRSLDVGNEERFTESFSRGLLAVLRENKGLAEWLVNPSE